MNINRIFLDLDDVLNCCTMTCLRRIGCPVKERDLHLFDPEWEFDIVKAANAIHPTKKFTTESFWWEINRGTWRTMPKSEECDWLIELCVDIVGRKNICVLTTPINDPDCAAGKVEWIQENLPGWLHRQFLIGLPKWICAHHGALLIDDKYQNVVEFRRAGGQAIVVPRPWNLHYNKDPKVYLEAALKCLR